MRAAARGAASLRAACAASAAAPVRRAAPKKGEKGGNGKYKKALLTRVAALDVEELLHAHVRAEARLGDHVALLAHQLERDLVCDNGRVA